VTASRSIPGTAQQSGLAVLLLLLQFISTVWYNIGLAACAGSGALTEDVTVCGSITREDVADLAIKALLSPKTDNKVKPCTQPIVSLTVASAR